MVFKKVLLCYAPEKPGILAPSAGYIFACKRSFGASRFGSRAKKFRMGKEANWIEKKISFDARQIAPDLSTYAAAEACEALVAKFSRDAVISAADLEHSQALKGGNLSQAGKADEVARGRREERAAGPQTRVRPSSRGYL